jgi:hypothetical protein
MYDNFFQYIIFVPNNQFDLAKIINSKNTTHKRTLKYH